MMDSTQIDAARSDLRRLERVIPNLRVAGDSEFNYEFLDVKFSCSKDGQVMTVEVPWLSVTANANARPVRIGKSWKMEYAFCCLHGIDVVEVFRIYINDEQRASNKDDEEFGAVNGIDFIEYVCEGVCEGLLNSPKFAPSA